MATTKQAGSMIEVISPIDGKTRVGEVPSLTIEDALAATDRARKAQVAWGEAGFEERSKVLRRLLGGIRDHQDEIAQTLIMEGGKTRFEACVFEIASILHLGDYFLRNAPRILARRRISISVFKNRTSYMHYRPRGVVLVIGPWNFPLSNTMGEVLMGLIAGNAVLLKPASLTPLTAVLLRRIADEAGLAQDLFQVITGPGRLASELIEAGRPDFVSFTGSTETGRGVAALCARCLIPCTMELGGKAPALVLEDANLDTAVRSIVWGAFANSGQICASIERCLVHERLYDAFVEQAVAQTKALRQGDPRQDGVDVGAMTDLRQVAFVESLVQDAVSAGAKVLAGGKRAAAGACFFEPTVLVGVTPEMRVMKEESFGPLLPILKFKTDDEAVRIANDTRYGLVASVFSHNSRHARAVAERLLAGTVMINDTLSTHAYPETPWQGIRDSGFGRVHSDDGLRDLCLALHVNDEVFSMENPAWYPYTREKLQRVLGLVSLSLAGLPIRERLGAIHDIVCSRKARDK